MGCIFCEIAEGKRPSRIVHSDDQLVAFHDIRPQAPVHLLVVPRRHVTSLLDLGPGDDGLVGAMVRQARDLARELEERHGLRVVPGALAVRARHAITFRRITLEGYRARLKRPVPSDPERFLWARPEEVAALPVASSTRKLLKGLASPQLPLGL